MKKVVFKKWFLLVPFGIAAFLSLISYVVMQLWNHLLPPIMNVSSITFWQAMGIFILCKILFGFGGGHKGRASWKRRCGNMNEEQREKFKSEMKERMCFMNDKLSQHPKENSERQNS